MVHETKFDETFLNSQFHIDDFSLTLARQNHNGGGGGGGGGGGAGGVLWVLSRKIQKENFNKTHSST